MDDIRDIIGGPLPFFDRGGIAHWNRERPGWQDRLIETLERIGFTRHTTGPGPMKIVITIDTDNAAFEDGNIGPETARILRKLAERIETARDADDIRYEPVALHDINGNLVGTCKAD